MATQSRPFDIMPDQEKLDVQRDQQDVAPNNQENRFSKLHERKDNTMAMRNASPHPNEPSLPYDQPNTHVQFADRPANNHRSTSPHRRRPHYNHNSNESGSNGSFEGRHSLDSNDNLQHPLHNNNSNYSDTAYPSSLADSQLRHQSAGKDIEHADTPEKRKELYLKQKADRAREMNQEWEHKVNAIRDEEEARHAEAKKYVAEHWREMKDEQQEAEKRKEQHLKDVSARARELNDKWEDKVDSIQQRDSNNEAAIKNYAATHLREVDRDNDDAMRRKDEKMEEVADRAHETNQQWERKVSDIKDSERTRKNTQDE